MKFRTPSRVLVIPISLCAVLLVGAAYMGVAAYGSSLVAAQASGVTVRTLAVAQFDEIDSKAKSGDWEAEIKTEGLSDLHVVEVTIQPGGTLGWHSHVGPSFVVVKSGEATFYQGDDPNCTRHPVLAGASLFEPGGDVHIVRNEGSDPLVNVVVQLLPTGAPRLIPAPNPGYCPF